MARTTASVLICLVMTTGCYDSHPGTPIDAGPPRDGSALDGALRIDGATTISDPPPSMYVVSSLSLPAPSGGVAPGANLDGHDSGSGSTDPTANCAIREPDFTAPDGTHGVDDVLGRIIPSVHGLVSSASGGVDGALAAAIHGGDLLLGIEVQGTRVTLVRLAPPPRLMTDGVGHVAGGQRFAVTERLGTGVATVDSSGRMKVALGAVTLPVSGALGSVLGSGHLNHLELRFTPGASGWSDGELGATETVTDVVDAWSALVPGIADSARSLLESMADIGPRADRPDVCLSVSVGIAFDAVPATFVGT